MSIKNREGWAPLRGCEPYLFSRIRERIAKANKNRQSSTILIATVSHLGLSGIHGPTSLPLVPSGSGYDALRTDYLHMVEDGLLAGDAETFEDLMRRCSGIQAQLEHR